MLTSDINIKQVLIISLVVVLARLLTEKRIDTIKKREKNSRSYGKEAISLIRRGNLRLWPQCRCMHRAHASIFFILPVPTFFLSSHLPLYLFLVRFFPQRLPICTSFPLCSLSVYRLVSPSSFLLFYFICFCFGLYGFSRVDKISHRYTYQFFCDKFNYHL